MLHLKDLVLCAVLLVRQVACAPGYPPLQLAPRAASSVNAVAFDVVIPSASVVSGASAGESTTDVRPSSSVVSATAATATVAFASDQANGMLWSDSANVNPQPVRDQLGATILGPQNVPVAIQNPDLLAPPTTDSGNVSVIYPIIVSPR